MAKRGGFPGGMPGNMNNLMKQAQRMQRQMEEAQQKMEETEVEATAGGGAVTVKVSGKKEILSVKLQEEVVDPDDIEMLEDLIVAATNEALRKIEEMNQKIASMAEEAAETKAMSKNYQRLLEEVNELRRENKILSDQMKDAEIAHAGEIRKLEEAKHQAQPEAERLKRGGE